MKNSTDTRPPGYPGTLKQWEAQCRQQAKADREALAFLRARYAHQLSDNPP